MRRICWHDHHKKLFVKHNATSVPFSPTSAYKRKVGKCSAGHVWDDDVRTCVACAKGTYHSANVCVACPLNSTTDHEAAKTIESCKRKSVVVTSKDSCTSTRVIPDLRFKQLIFYVDYVQIDFFDPIKFLSTLFLSKKLPTTFTGQEGKILLSLVQ